MTQRSQPRFHSQSGGLTILVVLSMLVLMTVLAVGMSRNSLREIFIVGASRQSAVVRQAADSGLEYAILWADTRKTPSALGATNLQNTFSTLLSSRDNQGVSTAVATSGATDTVLPAPAGQTRSFSLKVLRLGKIQPVNTSGQLDERLFNDLWVIQSSGKVSVGATTFEHDKELWLTTTARTN
ncbi:MAG TPA: hypothetical protein VJ623_06610 [Holophagaceae bacterium]|nr:hypothetical protein [Holophagaceae bacterium]